MSEEKTHVPFKALFPRKNFGAKIRIIHKLKYTSKLEYRNCFSIFSMNLELEQIDSTDSCNSGKV